MSQTLAARQIAARDVHQLKKASAALVQRVGGCMAAAGLAQTTASRISEAVSEFHPNRFLSLVQVADLEAVAGDPLVTRALAEVAGCSLSRVEAQRPLHPSDHLVHILIVAGDVERELAEGLRDGKLDAAEEARVLASAGDAIDRLQRLRADLLRGRGVTPSRLDAVREPLREVT